MKRSSYVHSVIAVLMSMVVAAPAVANPAAVPTMPVAPAPLPQTAPMEQPIIEQPVMRPAPVLVISSYKTSAKRLLAGTEFDLTLDIKNETGRLAENVVVSLSPAAGGGPEAAAPGGSAGLTILGTGNAKYIGTVRGRTANSVSFKVVAGPSTPPGAMTVPVTITFEHAGERHELAYTIGLVFERDAKIDVTVAEYPKKAMVGEPFDASFEVANTSGFPLSGMSLSVECSSAVVTDGLLFVGAFDPAGTEGIDVTVVCEEPGMHELTLVAAYRDDFGKTKSFKTTYVVEVEGEPEPGDGSDGTDIDEGPQGSWIVRFFRAIFGLES